MRIYLVRHGIAADRNDTKYRQDELRPLTNEGRKKLKATAAGLRALGVFPPAIISSPLLRAKQTADLLARILMPPKSEIMIWDELVPAAHALKTLKKIAAMRPKPDTLMLVGHEPHLSSLISLCCCENTGMSIEMKKSGLCILRFDTIPQPGHAILEGLLTPAQLEKIS